MTAKTITDITPLLKQTASVRHHVALLPNSQRQKLVLALAEAIEQNIPMILAANAQDQNALDANNPMRDRLVLTQERLKNIAQDVRKVAELPDPCAIVQLESEIQPGLNLQRITVPLGVVGMIYESRPNVTIDMCALCLRSGNAAVLRGGSDAKHSNRAIVQVVHQLLSNHDLPTEIVYLLPIDRAHVKTLLTADAYIDILIPRGSKGLIDFVRAHATVPTIETGAGVCHTYVTKSADLPAAAQIVINAKISRPSVCNSLDTILIDTAVVETFLPFVVKEFTQASVEIFADEQSYRVLQKLGYKSLQLATKEDFGREFLDYKCSIKAVQSFNEAISHIAAHSSRHSEAICTQDTMQSQQFVAQIDAASVFVNASTRFSDGGMFGLGAEIGISTQKLHARGPFALEKLVTEKWVVHGQGHVRK